MASVSDIRKTLTLAGIGIAFGFQAIGGEWSHSLMGSGSVTILFAILNSENKPTCERMVHHASLRFACGQEKTSLTLSTDCFLFGPVEGYENFEIEIDTGERLVLPMNVNDRKDGINLGTDQEVFEFHEFVKNSAKTTFHFRPYMKDLEAIVFDTSRIEEGLKPIRKECGW